MSNTILVVAAHADDEVLGCGGTIARHIHEGDQVYVHFMTDGVSSRIIDGQVNQQQDLIIKRAQSAKKAADILGIEDIFQYQFPDNALDSIPLITITKSIEESINQINPSIIYTHFSGDLNIDHQLTHRAVMTACRPLSSSSIKEIYSFEVLSSTEWGTNVTTHSFEPNYIVNIDHFIEKKLDAIRAYEAELRPSPHSRSLEAITALAKLRGQTRGIQYAEAFMVQRILR